MSNLPRAFLNLRRLLITATLALAFLAPIFTPPSKAQQVIYTDPPPTAWAGLVIYTGYYQDDSYTGLHFMCEYNSCTGEEYCPLPKTPYGREVYRYVVSCTGIV